MQSLPDHSTDTTPAPEDATCVVRSGDRVEIRTDGFVFPDGQTIESLSGCKLESGAVLFIGWGDPTNRLRLLPKRKLASPTTPPEDVSAIAPDVTATTSAAVSAPSHFRDEGAATTTAVVAAVAIAALGVAVFKALHLSANAVNAQQQQREREQRACTTKSDTTRDNFAKTAETLDNKKLREIREPEAFFAKIDGMITELRVLPKAKPARKRKNPKLSV